METGSGIYGGSWQTGRAVLAAEVPRLTVFRLAGAEESNPVGQPGEATRAAGWRSRQQHGSKIEKIETGNTQHKEALWGLWPGR